jgi:hypothetical protein
MFLVNVMGLGIRDYLHEKAEESRHNETISYLMTVIGVVFLVGGVLVTVLKVEKPAWFLFIPFQLSADLYSILGLSFTVTGMSFLSLGVALSIHYAMDRNWYMSELHKAHMVEERRLKKQAS